MLKELANKYNFDIIYILEVNYDTHHVVNELRCGCGVHDHQEEARPLKFDYIGSLRSKQWKIYSKFMIK